MTKDEAMRLALEALECHVLGFDQVRKMELAIEALEQALEQPEQELVAWWCGGSVSTRKGYFEEMGWGPIKPLYTSPPKREWVSLTDEELSAIWGEFGLALMPVRKAIASEIEAKLKEKNI